MNPKIREKKSPIHENADANILVTVRSAVLGVSYLTHVIHTHIASSIIGRLLCIIITVKVEIGKVEV